MMHQKFILIIGGVLVFMLAIAGGGDGFAALVGFSFMMCIFAFVIGGFAYVLSNFSILGSSFAKQNKTRRRPVEKQFPGDTPHSRKWAKMVGVIANHPQTIEVARKYPSFIKELKKAESVNELKDLIWKYNIDLSKTSSDFEDGIKKRQQAHMKKAKAKAKKFKRQESSSANSDEFINDFFNGTAGKKQRQEEKKKMERQQHEKVLGVKLPYSKADLKKAYHKLAMKYHPDRTNGLPLQSRANAEIKMREINVAYAYLKNEVR